MGRITDVAATLAEVGHALRELRRGLPIVVSDRDPASDSDAVAVFAAELLSPAGLDQIRAWDTSGPFLAITAHRASVLHIPPSGRDIILLVIDAGASAIDLIGLADPTADLAHPLRGPFERSREPISAALLGVIRLCKSARLLPAAVVAPLAADMRPDIWAGSRGIALTSAPAIHFHDHAGAFDLRRVTAARVPLADAEDVRLEIFRPGDGTREHIAIVIGNPAADEPVLTRLHSRCFTGDLLASLRCDCGDQLRGAITAIRKAGGGVLIYLAQEGRDIGLVNKLRAYRLQDDGFDTIEANQRLGFEADERLFLVAARMLEALNYRRVRLMTNNPDKVAALELFGIEVCQRVAHAFPPNNHNETYLATKARRSGHYLDPGKSGG